MMFETQTGKRSAEYAARGLTVERLRKMKHVADIIDNCNFLSIGTNYSSERRSGSGRTATLSSRSPRGLGDEAAAFHGSFVQGKKTERLALRPGWVRPSG